MWHKCTLPIAFVIYIVLIPLFSLGKAYHIFVGAFPHFPPCLPSQTTFALPAWTKGVYFELTLAFLLG